MRYQSVQENTVVKGIYKKYTHKTYSHQITILNTKTTPIENLHVIDSIPGPVSQDERIHVSLLIPELSLPTGESASSAENVFMSTIEQISIHDQAFGHRIQSAEKVQVMAHWDGDGEPDIDQNMAGKNGRVNWTVALGVQDTATLTLKYEVSYPDGLVVEGI